MTEWKTDGQSITPPSALRMLETGSHSHSLKDLVSLPQLVHDSIMSCDVDVRGALLQSIVVVGNTSLTRGLTERLDVELANLMPGVSCAVPVRRLELTGSKRSKSTRRRFPLSASTRRGSVDRSWLVWERSTSCGSPRTSMRSTGQRSYTSVSRLNNFAGHRSDGTGCK